MSATNHPVSDAPTTIEARDTSFTAVVERGKLDWRRTIAVQQSVTE